MAVSGGKATREKMIDKLFEFVQNQRKGANSLSQTATNLTADAYFQQDAIGSRTFRKVYGTSKQFLKTYEDFVEEYFEAVGDQANIAKGKKVNIDLMRRKGGIDLTVLNKEKADELYQRYLRDVLKIDQLIGQAGLPGIEIPSGNAFGSTHRFLTSFDYKPGQEVHPAHILINRLYLNFNEHEVGLSAINVGRKNILNMRALERIVSQSADVRSPAISQLEEGASIVTFDIESTSVSQNSHARSFSAVRSTVESGELSAPVAVRNELFDSPQLNPYRVGTSGGSISLSEMLAKAEGAGSSKEMGAFLDELTTFINDDLLSAQHIAGHNVWFDLGKLTETAMDMPGFESHSDAQAALRTLWNRIYDEDNYLVDTLETARMYLEDKVSEHLNSLYPKSSAVDIGARSEEYVNRMISAPLRARVHIGGSTGPSTMENIVLNTNLLELLEDDGNAGALFHDITRGSHVSLTDSHLQAYLFNYMRSGRLNIRSLETSSRPESDFAKYTRAKVLKSQAVTPTSDIGDIRMVSQNTFNYITTRGLKDVTINLENVQDIFGPQFSEGPGTLIHSGGKYKILTDTGLEEISAHQQQLARNHVIDTLHRAADPTNLNMRIEVGTEVFHINREAELGVNSLGVTFATGSRADYMFDALEAAPPGIDLTRPLRASDDAYTAAFGSVYRTYGNGQTISQQISGTITGGEREPIFSMGLGGASDSAAKSISRAFAEIGDPFHFIDPESRAFSTMLANATADIGAAANAASIRAGADAASIAFSANPKRVAELGISYFKAQESASIFRPFSHVVGIGSSSAAAADPSKLIVPRKLLSHVLESTMPGKPMQDVSLSVANRRQGQSLNLVWSTQGKMTRDESRALVAEMFDILGDEDKTKQVFGVDSLDDLDQTIKQEAAFVRTVRQQGAGAMDQLIDVATDLAHDRKGGIVFGFNDSEVADEMIAGSRALGIDPDNDMRIAGLTGHVIESQLDEGTIPVSPFMFDDALDIVDARSRVDEAIEVVSRSGSRGSRATHAYNRIAERVVGDEALGRAVDRGIRIGKAADGATRYLTEFYVQNRGKIGAGLAAAGLAAFGYYKMKQNKEEELIDETIKPMPVEARHVAPSTRSFDQGFDFTPQRTNPLATAGVVRTLDQNKIGHYRMGPNKNDHLFAI